MPLEQMGPQLMAELNGLKPQIEACLRVTPASASGDGTDPAALIRDFKTSALMRNQPPLSGEEQALLHKLEVAAASAVSHTATPRSLLLDVETGDGEVRILDVPPGSEGSAFLSCARQALSGRTVRVPGAKAGSRLSLALPLRSGSEPSGSEWALEPDAPQEGP
jgi:hypothetical protein